MTDERITAYLLEELTEREAEQFEEQCFAHPEWPARELDSAEDDLIEAYLRKELSPDRQRRFEEKYLTTPARKERVLLARSFLHVVCSAQSPKATLMERIQAFWNVQSLTPKYATVVVLALGLASLLWLLIPSSPQTFANLNLTLTSETRSTGASTVPPQKVTLPLGADALRVSLTLPESTPEGSGYRVQWEDVKGRLKTLEIESQDARSIKVVIPADELRPGQYILKLFRKNPDKTEHQFDGDYFFEVE